MTKLPSIIIAFCLVLGIQRSVSAEPKYEAAELREYVGAIDRNGKFVIPPKFRYLQMFKHGFASASAYDNLLVPPGKHRRFATTGLVNLKGDFVIPPIYSGLRQGDDGIILVTAENWHHFVLNNKGEVLADFEPNSSPRLLGSKRLLIGSEWKNYGMCSPTGKTIIKQDKNLIFPFFEKHAVAEVNGYYAVPHETPEEYKAHEGVDIDFCPILYSSKTELIDVNGKVIIPPRYDGLRPLSKTNFFFKDGSKWGVLTTDGRKLLDPIFDDVDMPLKSNIAEKRLCPGGFKFDFTFPNESKAVVRLGNKFSFVHFDGSRCFDKDFDDAYSFSEGMAPVAKKVGAYKQLRYGYLEAKGSLSIDCQYEFARPFHEGVARVKAEKGWGVINKHGKYVFAPTFDSISEFNDGLAVADREDRWFILRKDGTQLEVPGVSHLRPFSEGLAAATSSQPIFYAVETGSKMVVERPATDGDEEIVSEVRNPPLRILKKAPATKIPIPNIPAPASAKNAKEV